VCFHGNSRYSCACVCARKRSVSGDGVLQANVRARVRDLLIFSHFTRPGPHCVICTTWPPSVFTLPHRTPRSRLSICALCDNKCRQISSYLGTSRRLLPHDLQATSLSISPASSHRPSEGAAGHLQQLISHPKSAVVFHVRPPPAKPHHTYWMELV
jgi:hypothetical protein